MKAPGEKLQRTGGGSLPSSYANPSLENKLLVPTPSLMAWQNSSLFNFAAQPSSCLSLQPTTLSSTSSTLLPSSSLSSPLLSTQNKLLKSGLSKLSLGLTSTSGPSSSLLSTTLASNLPLTSAHLNESPSFLCVGLDGGQTRDEGGEELSEASRRCFEETSVYSNEMDVMPERDVEMDTDSPKDSPVLEKSGDQDQDQTAVWEEFPEVDHGNEGITNGIKEKKYLLLNAVCCSLVNKCPAPGQKDWEESVWTRIINLAKDISDHDPQFLLKVAVYTRQELNIRITANFLLALAANQTTTKCHVRRYFCAAVQLPSDWLEVVRIYSTCFSRSLPMCLKKAMTDKFKQFSEYQLAKYNTRKHRCKHKPKTRRTKANSYKMKEWANLLRSDATILTKFLHIEGKKSTVDKKQSEFSLKKMIKRLHIKEPAEHVMAILGKKYPADVKAFTRSGMTGAWDRERAGKRMKLKEPETWERLLSQEGNKAATWEKLIDNKSLPFMAMLRNLRNMITQGISGAHHNRILSRLANEKAVIQSRQLPFRFLAAYKVIMELYDMARKTQKAIPPAMEILKGILKKIPKSKRFHSLDWETTNRSRLRVTLGVPFVNRIYKKKKALLLKAGQMQYTAAVLDSYRKALETAVQISCRYNVPPLPGRTLILLSHNMHHTSWEKANDFCLPPDPEQEKKEKEKEKEEEKQEESEGEDEGSRESDSEQEREEEEKGSRESDSEQEEEEEKEKKRSSRRRKRREEEDDQLSPSMMEVAVLLSLMIKSNAEDSQFFLTEWNNCLELKVESEVLLDNVKSVMKQIKENHDRRNTWEDSSIFSTMFTHTNKVDNIILLCDSWIEDGVEFAINRYRKDVNNKALFIKVTMREGSEKPRFNDKNYVELMGFSEQMLRFVAERGSSRLLDHVEHLDRMYNIPPQEGAKDPQSGVVSIPTSPKLRWQGVRVFISSTFRDMHAERDVLVRSVFPELRRRAAPHCLHLQEVELRWGVTEEESTRATELCLSEVCRSQMLLGILGERYGEVPPRPTLPDLPQYSWLRSAPDGLSITEMEILQFQALYPKTASQRMLCYFRDPNIIKSVPVAWRSHFSPESKEAESKMASLKRRLRFSNVKVTENYTCEWGGVVDGKPYLKDLEDFGRAVLEDLWMAVKKQFVEEDERPEVASDVTEQEIHQGALRTRFLSRGKVLSAAVEMVEQVQAKGGSVMVDGARGEGKTVFMAALAEALRTGAKSRQNLVCDVLSYSTAASQSARTAQNLLLCLVKWLRKLKDAEEEPPLPLSYKDLVSEFQSTLGNTKRSKPLVLVVDGVELLRDGRGQLSSDWIPQELPQGVCLVMSATSNSPLTQTLAKRKGTQLFALGQLTLPDRREIVQKGLDAFGKKLNDSAFNNQLQTLIMKKGAASPLYLHLACEDLRSFASFDKLKESLQGLPQSLGQLVQCSLERLCSQHRDICGLHLALAALTVSPTGLREQDFYSLLCTCNDLSSGDKHFSWQEALQLARKPKARVPMATFSRIVQSLQSLMCPSHCHNTDDLLSLTNPEVKQAFESVLLPTRDDGTRAHLVLAAHLWALADSQGRDTFLHCEANCVQDLSTSLIQSDQLEVLCSLLSNYYFLYANVRHSLLHHLLETYGVCDKKNKCSNLVRDQDPLQDCRGFLQRHAPLLSSWPVLFVQQALNEPPETPAHEWARGLAGVGNMRVVEWLNNNSSQTARESSELMSTFASEPCCLVLNPDEEVMVVGTRRGTLHCINTQTGQEVKTLESSCDGISSCLALRDGCLATTSFDGQIEMWDVANGCRTALIRGHSNAITASDVTADKKHLATVSLDSMLKVWASAKGNEVAALQSTSPLNCVTFDPEDCLVAAGCWNGKVIVWNWLRGENETVLSGHQRSVRSLSFSPSSSMLCSGSVSGEVRVWSVSTSTCVGCFQAHCGAAEALTFLDEGGVLLSAGSDHMLQLWSGGLGRSVGAIRNEDQEPPQKRRKCVTSEAAALCAAVNGDYVAVGYHGDGVKLFHLSSGEMVWASEGYDVFGLCLLWLSVEVDGTTHELLLSGGADKRVRVWRRDAGKEGMMGGLTMVGMMGVQIGAFLAMAQNSTYLATASEDFTIALWTLAELPFDPCTIPAHPFLRGHKGAVTCLAFSPDGDKLLSGGRDQALMVWDVSASPVCLFKALPHAHRDWITGCAWTADCMMSCSNDGRVLTWDLEATQSLREISWSSPLTSLCCLGPYAVAGSADGMLHVWSWETGMEISHISAHRQRVNHCSIPLNADKNKEINPGEMTVVTASDDGVVKLWKPLQVEHLCTFHGHSGPVCGVICKEGGREFLSVSEDGSLRCWTRETENPPSLTGSVTAISFSQTDEVILIGYELGSLEVWRHGEVLGRNQVPDSVITSICSMPDDQFAVSYKSYEVDVWKLVWNQQRSSAGLVKTTTFAVKGQVNHLVYCSELIGITNIGSILRICKDSEDDDRTINWLHTISGWDTHIRVLGVIPNDEKSSWLVGESNGEVTISFFFAMGPTERYSTAYSTLNLKQDNKEEGFVTAVTVDRDLMVCGDEKGNMWFNNLSAWSAKKPAHSDRVSVLRLTRSTIISASFDRTVKMWDRNTKKQVGMFVCSGPVLAVEVNPDHPSQLVCGDGLGKLYFLSWKE